MTKREKSKNYARRRENSAIAQSETIVNAMSTRWRIRLMRGPKSK